MIREIEVGAPDWGPLEDAFSQEQCVDFMFMGAVGAIVLYKHRGTRRYLNIDSETRRFYKYVDGDYTEISRERAIEHVCGPNQI